MSTSYLRCKLRCIGVGLPSGGDNSLSTVSFMAQYESPPSEENKVFGSATPAANFNMTLTESLGATLEVGKDYYFDIHKVPEA